MTSNVATQPLFDDPWSSQEYEARVQLGLSDDWRLSQINYGVEVGFDRAIEALNRDSNLTDDERWESIESFSPDVIWLPRGMAVVTMARGDHGAEKVCTGIVQFSAPSHSPTDNAEASQ